MEFLQTCIKAPHQQATVAQYGNIFTVQNPLPGLIPNQVWINDPAVVKYLTVKCANLYRHPSTFTTRNVTFQVPRGQVCAFLGPNGAGKSTTMKMLTGYLAPSEGSASIGGHNVATDRIAASQLVGYLPENGPLYEEMTPKSLLEYLGAARGLSGRA